MRMYFLKYLCTETKAFHTEFHKLLLQSSTFGVWYTKLGVRSKFCRVLYDSVTKSIVTFQRKKKLYLS